MNHLDGALAWWDAGMAVIPARADGSKRPVHEWKSFMGVRPPREQVHAWYNTNPNWGVGIVCGTVSGNLEMLEIEAVRMGGEHLDLVRDHMNERGVLDIWDELLDRGYCEFTPSGGIHILYRIVDEPVPGNQKIAMSGDSKITYAETRGEGGFVIVAPSSGQVHPSGEAWSAAGESKVGNTPMQITWECRQALHSALKAALDERVVPVYERPAGGSHEYDRSQGDRPGDAFNEDDSVTIHDILTRNGWKYLGRKQGQDEYVHPASSDMSTGSARTGHQGSPNLYAWSGMPQEGSYDKFAVLTHLEYGGDFSAASRDLRKQGYGSDNWTGGDDLDDWATDPSVTPEQASGTPQAPAPVLEGFSHKDVANFARTYILSRFRHVHEERGWRMYQDGRWIRDIDKSINRAAQRVGEVVKRKAQEILDQAKQGGDKDEIAEAKKLVTFGASLLSTRGNKDLVEAFAVAEGVSVSIDVFDQKLNLLVLANGTFDLETMELREHRATDMLTKRIDIEYDADATAPTWERAWGEIMPDAAMGEYLQTGVGMTAWGSTREAAFFLLHGESGCGKSLFLEVMEAAMGEYAATAAPAAFRTSRYGEKSTNDLHSLKGSRFVSTSESSQDTRLDEELIKRITGGDRVTSRALFQDNVTWRPRFTMFMATNHRPQMAAEDGAIWRRVKPVEFPVSFFKEGRKADVGLADRITGRELPGVLNWILEGARRYAKQGLVDPTLVSNAVESYREEVDPIRTFLTEAVEEGRILLDPEVEMRALDLYNTYSAWCVANSIRPMGAVKFGRRMTAAGIPARKGGGGVQYRTGVKINPSFGFASAQKADEKYW